MLLERLSRWFKPCQERESREVCHQSFWCGDDRAHGLNLSNGGMCLRLARRAEPGEKVILSHGPVLKVKGRIAWTRRLQHCTEVGVEFLDTAANCERWTSYLRAEGLREFRPGPEPEPVLALPAPGESSYTGFGVPLRPAPHMYHTH